MLEHECWLKLASDDLKAARILQNSGEILPQILYYSHQCAENALKTYIVYNKHEFDKTHDLLALFNICKTFDEQCEKFRASATELTPYASSTRYPDNAPIILDTANADHCIKMATEILEFVRSKI